MCHDAVRSRLVVVEESRAGGAEWLDAAYYSRTLLDGSYRLANSHLSEPEVVVLPSHTTSSILPPRLTKRNATTLSSSSSRSNPAWAPTTSKRSQRSKEWTCCLWDRLIWLNPWILSLGVRSMRGRSRVFWRRLGERGRRLRFSVSRVGVFVKRQGTSGPIRHSSSVVVHR